MPGGALEAQFVNLPIQLQRVFAALGVTLFQMLEIRMEDSSGIGSRRALRETVGVSIGSNRLSVDVQLFAYGEQR